MDKIILASASPRRKELLEQIGLKFEIITSDCDEDFEEGLSPETVVSILAERKAKNVLNKISKEDLSKNRIIIISADTIVSIDNKILGKPKHTDDAFNMLKALQGRKHFVYTGMSVIIKTSETQTVTTVFEESSVYMNPLSESEITSYINTKEPLDKAGAYAVQGIASLFINKIEGNYNNIVGLPVSTLYCILKNNNINFFR